MKNKYMKKWMKKNMPRILAERKLKLKTDPKYRAQKAAQNKRNYEKHKAERNRKMSKYLRKIYKKNIPYTLACICRARINEALRNQGVPRYYPYTVLIGCSWKDLQKYLEKQFKPGMKWKDNTHYKKHNKKAFHIDHIKSISSFDLLYGRNQLKAFNFKNMQLLFARDHFKKSAKYMAHIETEIRKNKCRVREYTKALKNLESR